jgi:hypothetical protein
MAETMIIPIITALAPYVLDSLFGEGKGMHIPKHVRYVVDIPNKFSPPSIKEMSMYGYGYRYPSRRDIKLLLNQDFAKAKILNRAIAAQNPWIQHLKKTGTYDEIRRLLNEAKKSYVPKDPLSSKKSALSRKRRLEAELEALGEYAGDIGKLYKEYGYGDEASYSALLQNIKNKIIAEKEALDTKVRLLQDLMAKK